MRKRLQPLIHDGVDYTPDGVDYKQSLPWPFHIDYIIAVMAAQSVMGGVSNPVSTSDFLAQLAALSHLFATTKFMSYLGCHQQTTASMMARKKFLQPIIQMALIKSSRTSGFVISLSDSIR